MAIMIINVERIMEKEYCNERIKLVIPNKEVSEVYKLQIQEWFEKSLFSNVDQLQSFWKSFAEGNTEEIEKYLNKVLSNSISVFDTKGRNEEKESSYHNLLTGILTGNADWLVKSNVEAMKTPHRENTCQGVLSVGSFCCLETVSSFV